MKNVLIHLSPPDAQPRHAFDKERWILSRIQIDNSLRLGWKVSDILLVTNFPYEYQGVKSIVVADDNYCAIRPRSTNTITVPHLFELGLIEKDEVYWVHDFDAYQMDSIDEVNEKLSGVDVGLTTYGWSAKWCMGSFFFKYTARDFFEWVKEEIYSSGEEDERALRSLTRSNFNGINDRYKVLNITYNIGMRHVEYNYGIADKPLKVVHFHPYCRKGGLRPLQSFMYGENGLGIPLMTEDLIKVFNMHGVK